MATKLTLLSRKERTTTPLTSINTTTTKANTTKTKACVEEEATRELEDVEVVETGENEEVVEAEENVEHVIAEPTDPLKKTITKMLKTHHTTKHLDTRLKDLTIMRKI